METIDIQTGQNVMIQYQSATVLQRLGALLLDTIFIAAYFFIIYFAYLLVVIKKYLGIIQDWTIVIAILFFLPVLGYHLIFETLLGGRTPGKMIVRIKVTNIDGSTPGLGSYFLRWVLRPIDSLFWGAVGALCIILSKNHQRLGDMAAGTIVVKTDPSLMLDLDRSYYEFSDDYEPTFTNVDRLSTGQINFISTILFEPKNKKAMMTSISELADKVKKILEVESDWDDRRFLEVVVRDYNYYAVLEI